MENTGNKPGNTLLRVLVIAGILIILIFLSIGIVKVVPKILNSIASTSLSLGNIFSNKDSKKDSKVVATTPTPTGTDTSTATSSGFSISDLTNPATTTPVSTSPVDTNSQIAVKNTSSKTKTSYNSYTYTTKSSTVSTAKTVGPSDIAVEIKSIGIINKTTGQFVASNSFTSSDMIVVKFKIENRGIYATGAWSARVEMPSYDSADKVRLLGPINSLPAGTAVEGEARFNNPISGNQAVTINVDIGITTQDTNRGNNSASINLLISTINTNPINPIVYPVYPNNYYQNNNSTCYYQNGYYYGNCSNVVNTDYSNTNSCYYANGIYYGNCSNNNSYYNNNYYNQNNYNNTYYQNSDLEVRILGTGIINSSGQFISNAYPRRGDKLAVQFEIRNIGNQSTPTFSWTAEASGATSNNYSSTEYSLSPNQSIVRVSSFETLYNTSVGNVNFTVKADVGNVISEQNENNNTASASLYLNY